MKIVTAMVAGILLLAGCTDKKEQALARRWRVADVVFVNDGKGVVQSDTMQGEMLQRQRAVIKDVLMKNLYEFKPDGTYITGNAAGSATGTWDISGNNIVFKSDAAKDKGEKRIPFEHLSEDSVVLLFEKDQTSTKLKLILLPTE